MDQTGLHALDAIIDTLPEFLRSVRRHLHSHPEPSLHEFETTAQLSRLLADEGIPHQILPSRRGLIAGPPIDRAGPIIALRADIDALRIQDAKLGVPYRSTIDGVMHGCGHDAHATMLLGAAIALHRCPGLMPPGVAWRAIFQPAEETTDGAIEMIEAGAMAGVTSIIALHVDPELEVGRVAHRSGVLTAACHTVRANFRGRGGHAARPHQALDPIAAAAQFLNLVYQAAPRAVDVREPLIITFGSIHGGTAANVIPDEVELLGTMRSLSQSARERATSAIQAIARGIHTATGVEVEVAFLQSVAPVMNDPGVIAALTRAASAVLGVDALWLIPHPSLGGEDFSAYLTYAPGALLRLGVAGSPGWPPLHSPRFDIDENALPIGAKILARATVILAWGDRSDES